MNPIPTAEEFMTDVYQINQYGRILLKPTEAAIEFAKLHVKAALEAASKNAEVRYDWRADIDESTILNAYPNENIK